MIGWLKRLFRRPEVVEVEIEVETDDERADAPLIEKLDALPHPETFQEALKAQLAERRRIADKLADGSAMMLADEDEAALTLANYGRHAWTLPSRADKLREKMGIDPPPPPREPTIHEVAASARIQLDEAQAKIAALSLELEQERRESRKLLAALKGAQEDRDSSKAILSKYAQSMQHVHDALTKARAPTTRRERGTGYTVMLSPWERIAELAKKRRKKTTPRRRA